MVQLLHSPDQPITLNPEHEELADQNMGMTRPCHLRSVVTISRERGFLKKTACPLATTIETYKGRWVRIPSAYLALPQCRDPRAVGSI